MERLKTVFVSFLVAVLVLMGYPASADEDLGEVLRASGWERIIGQWVDADTNGERNKVSYSWRFQDKVIESVLEEEDGESVSLMGYNPKTKEVFHVSADNQGGSSIGKWTFENNTATLELLFISGDKQEGNMRIRNEFKDDDTIIVTIDLDEPISFEMKRVKDGAKP